MEKPADPAPGRGPAVVVAFGLLVMAGALAAYSLDQSNTADFVRTLSLPGSQPPDTSTFDSLAVGALTEALGALLLAAIAAFLRGRGFFAITAIWSLMAVGTGAWIASESSPRLESVSLGPLQVPTVLVGVVLAIAAAVSLAGSAAGWMAARPEPGPAPHMPPQTHQA